MIAHAKGLGWGVAFGVASFLCITGALAWLRVDPNRKLVQQESAEHE
jgi:hypothetical protein